MKILEKYSGLVELEVEETRVISGGNGIFYRLGSSAHKAYCFIMDWAMEYEGDPLHSTKDGRLIKPYPKI